MSRSYALESAQPSSSIRKVGFESIEAGLLYLKEHTDERHHRCEEGGQCEKSPRQIRLQR